MLERWKQIMIYHLFNIYNIFTYACISYIKWRNCVKGVLSLEKVGVTRIFPEPDSALAVSIVYIIPHYNVLLKKWNLDHNYKCLLNMTEGRKKNLIMYNHSFLPDFLCKEVFLVLIFLSEKSECYKFVIESRFNHISNSSSSPRR